jgi:hypothetical protein
MIEFDHDFTRAMLACLVLEKPTLVLSSGSSMASPTTRTRESPNPGTEEWQLGKTTTPSPCGFAP